MTSLRGYNRPDVPTLAIVGLSLAYPLLALVGVRALGATPVFVALLVLLAARLVLPAARAVPAPLLIGQLVVVVVIALTGIWNDALAVRLYPVVVNAVLLVSFLHSLQAPQSMIEQFARVFEPDLPESGVRYTRTVTQVWCVFFLFNGAISLVLALWGDWWLWALYCGGIAYLAAGTLFAVEFLIRRRVRARAMADHG